MASSSTTKICAWELSDISSSDSDETRPVIVFVPLFLKAWARGLQKKGDLIVGNESDSGYDSNSFYTYEIFILACAPCGVLARFLL
jgi:hypothetical protein